MRRRHGRASAWREAVVASLLALGACGPRLHVETARLVPLDPSAGVPARLELTANYSDFALNPQRPVRFHVGDEVRWVVLRPADATSGIWVADAPEAGYSFHLDLAQRRIEATEPAWLPRNDGMLPIAIGQAATRACTTIWLTPADGTWTFSGRQAHCK